MVVEARTGSRMERKADLEKESGEDKSRMKEKQATQEPRLAIINKDDS